MNNVHRATHDCFLDCASRRFVQVLDLGITRLLVQRLLRLYPDMCAGHVPMWGSLAAILNEAYHRLLFLGRRSMASRSSPGKVHSRCSFAASIAHVSIQLMHREHFVVW